jgi:uncharacterized repeat protein (TIGR03803 family)
MIVELLSTFGEQRLVDPVIGIYIAFALSAGLASSPGLPPPPARFEVLHAFDAPVSKTPWAPLVRHSSGDLYGVLVSTGPYGSGGAIFKYLPADARAEIVYRFRGPDGSGLISPLVEGPGRALFGTTLYGGTSGNGTIFRYDVPTSTLTTLFSFGASAYYPHALLFGRDGKLYGTTGYSDGTLFRFDPATAAFTILHTFSTDEGGPWGELLQAADGKLYGTTNGASFGSNPDRGIIYRYDLSTSTYTTLHVFAGGVGGNDPEAGLLQAVDGRLYGTTTRGGSGGSGTLFRYDPATGTHVVLRHFIAADGASPAARLITGPDGALYGTTDSGGGSTNGGTLFRYHIATAAFTTLERFDGTHGFRPHAGVVDSGDGRLIGATATLGLGLGTLYRFDPSGGDLVTVHVFSGAGPATPVSTLARDRYGVLYGTSVDGGPTAMGTIFRYDVSTAELTALHSFTESEGRNPRDGVIATRDGTLLGTTPDGGPNHFGTLYRLDPVSGSLTTLHNFGFNTAPGPLGTLAEAEEGTIYGTTSTDPGSHGRQTIFRYDPNAGTVSTVFQTFTTGSFNGVAMGSDGALWGTTTGGPNILFRFDPVQQWLTREHYFSLEDPRSGVVEAKDGRLYGVTAGGGPVGRGTVYRYDPALATYTVLHSFSGPDGAYPTSTLVQGVDGALYGTTQGGGPNDLGTIFRFDPRAQPPASVRTLHAFSGADGSRPIAGLVEGVDRGLYGTCSAGGANDGGVLFRIYPPSR